MPASKWECCLVRQKVGGAETPNLARMEAPSHRPFQAGLCSRANLPHSEGRVDLQWPLWTSLPSTCTVLGMGGRREGPPKVTELSFSSLGTSGEVPDSRRWLISGKDLRHSRFQR